jgi:hypothetical protein
MLRVGRAGFVLGFMIQRFGVDLAAYGGYVRRWLHRWPRIRSGKSQQMTRSRPYNSETRREDLLDPHTLAIANANALKQRNIVRAPHRHLDLLVIASVDKNHS